VVKSGLGIDRLSKILGYKMTLKRTKVWSRYDLYYPSVFREDANGELVQVELEPVVEREFTTPKNERISLCIFESGVWVVSTAIVGYAQKEVRLHPERREALDDFSKKYKKYFKRDIITAKKEKGYSLIAKKRIKDTYDIGTVIIHEMDTRFLEKAELANWELVRSLFRDGIKVVGWYPSFQKGQLLAELQKDW
jgi:hypothetical protein